MATIEIKAKDITGLDNPHHLYIVYINDAGKKSYIRGGTTNDNALIDNIGVKSGDYIDGTPDWNDGIKTHYKQTIFQGTDAEVQAKIDLMQAEASRINY